MKTILAALFAIASAGASLTSAAGADLAGTWTVTIVGPHGNPLTFTLTMEKENGADATLIAPTAETRAAKVALKGANVTIKFSVDDPDGRPGKVELTGTVDGDTMKGITNLFGEAVVWNATRTSRVVVVPLLGSVRDLHTRTGLPGAAVTVTQHTTGAKMELITGARGAFRIATLEPGAYTIAVAMPGYPRMVADNFCVAPGTPAVFNAALSPGRGEQPPSSRPSNPTVVPRPPSVPASGSMSTAEVEQAMEFANRSSQIKAIPLTQATGLNRYRAGLLFTPFLRVAMMTQVARAANKGFTAGDIPAALTERLAWIVGRPEAHYVQSSDLDSPAYLAGVTDVVIRPPAAGDPSADIKPVWKIFLNTVCDTEQLESILGNQFSRPGLVAAFPIDALVAGNTVVFTFSKAAMPLDGFRGIIVTPAERRVVLTREHLQQYR